MNAHVLLNLLNEFGESDKMRGLFNKFNNTGARMLDSIYHLTLKLIKNPFLASKSQEFANFLRTVIMNVIA